MAFDLTALANYTDQTREELIVRQQLSSKTAKLVTKVTEVKSPKALQIMNSTVTFQVNGCGFNAQDTTTLSQRVITPGDIKVNEKLCSKDLASKWASHMLSAGARDEKFNLPFEEAYTMHKADLIAGQIEVAMWKGDTASGNPNLNKFNGYIKIVDAEANVPRSVNGFVLTGTVATTSGATSFAGTGTSFTTQLSAGDKVLVGANTYTIASVTNNTTAVLSANAAATVTGVTAKAISSTSENFIVPITNATSTNAYAITMSTFRNIPAEIIDKGEEIVMFCGNDFFRLFLTDITSKNFFHYKPDSPEMEYIIPGTNVRLIAVNGLNGTNRIYAGALSNFYYGVDLADDSERFELFYAKEADEIRFISEFRAGVQVGIPSEITQFALFV